MMPIRPQIQSIHVCSEIYTILYVLFYLTAIALPLETGIPADDLIEQMMGQILQWSRPLMPTLKSMIIGREVLGTVRS